MFINKKFLENIGSLYDLKIQLEQREDLNLDLKNSDFEKLITLFIIDKVKSGGLDNTPEIAKSLFFTFQKLGKKNNIHCAFSQGFHVLNQIKTEINQKNYAELLSTFLESNDIKPSISFLEKNSTSSSKNSLLPQTEYPPPLEPGHWSNIGIAQRARSFNPSQKTKSIFEIFSTKNLKKLFLWAFPWGVDVSLSGKNKKSGAMTIDEKNLLEIPILIPSEIQYKTIQCLLLSLDALGKACGQKGELSLENYDDIKYISDLSQLLSNELKNLSNNNLSEYQRKIETYAFKLREKDQALYDKKLYNSKMNNFCHANEKHSAEILQIEYKSSILVPPSPSHVVLKKKPDFKKRNYPHS